MLSWLHRTRGYFKHYTFLEWSTNETLQLQRLAYQGLGSGSWSGYADAIPTTQPGEELGNLPLAYATCAQGKREEGVQGGDAGEKGGLKADVTRRADAAPTQDPKAVDGSETTTITICSPSGSVASSRASAISRENSSLEEEDTMVSPLTPDYDEGEEPRLHDPAAPRGCPPAPSYPQRGAI